MEFFCVQAVYKQRKSSNFLEYSVLSKEARRARFIQYAALEFGCFGETCMGCLAAKRETMDQMDPHLLHKGKRLLQG